MIYSNLLQKDWKISSVCILTTQGHHTVGKRSKEREEYKLINPLTVKKKLNHPFQTNLYIVTQK